MKVGVSCVHSSGESTVPAAIHVDFEAAGLIVNGERGLPHLRAEIKIYWLAEREGTGVVMSTSCVCACESRGPSRTGRARARG